MSRYFQVQDQPGAARRRPAAGAGHRAGRRPLAASRGRCRSAARRVGNRLAIQPMEGCDGNLDGTPSELTLRRYRRFGAGGAKLIWGEACAVVPEGRANPRQLLIDEIDGAGASSSSCTTCRQAHVESLRLRRRPPRRPATHPLGPLLVPPADPRPARPAARSPDDRRSRPPAATASAQDPADLRRRARPAAGPLRRRGQPGLPDRLRLRRPQAMPSLPAQRAARGPDAARQVRRLVREPDAVHPRAGGPHPGRPSRRLIATRLNVFDGIPYEKGPDGRGVPAPFTPPVHSCWGTSRGRPVRARPEPSRSPWSACSAQAGVALVNVSLGNPYASPHLIRPFEYPPPDGYETPEHPLIGVDRHFRLTAEIQRAFPDLAVVGSGYSWLQAFAFEAGAANVRAGRTTFVGIGRGALAQPDFGRRVHAGRAARPQTPVPDLQLLHGADAVQAQRAGPVPHRLPTVRQGGLRADLGRGPAMRSPPLARARR